MNELSGILAFIKRYQQQGVNFFWYSFQTIGTMLLSAIIFFVAAKLLTPEVFGKYNYLLALVSFFVLFGNFGLSASVSKYVAEYKVKDEKKINSIVFSSLLICLILCLLIIVFIVLFGRILFKENYKYFKYIIPLIFLIASVNIFDGFYRGLKEFKKLSIVSIISGLTTLCGIFFLIKYFYLIGAILSQILYYGLFFILLFIFIPKRHSSFDKEISIQVFTYSMVIGVSGISYFLYTRADILILEYFGYVVEIGYYEIINKLFRLLYIPFAILGLVIAPDITRLMAEHKYHKLRYYFNKLYYVFFIGILMSILTYLFFPQVMRLMLSEYLSESFLKILNILLILLPFKVAGTLLTNGFIVPSGFANIIAYLTIIGGIVNIVLDFVFIKYYGFIGVFYVTVLVHGIADILTFVIYGIVFRKRHL